MQLFEATACGTPVVSDAWPGIEAAFAPAREMLTAHDCWDMLAALDMAEAERTAIGIAGRNRTLLNHTGEQRAHELIRYLSVG